MTINHLSIPGMPKGYPLIECNGDWFSVIVPEASTNLVTNPSFETGTTGWSLSSAGAIAQSATYQRFGAYSLRMTPTAGSADGVNSPAIPLAGFTNYTASLYFRSADTRTWYRLSIIAAGYSRYIRVKATGLWQRLVISFTTAIGANYQIRVAKETADTSTTPFYIDGVQLEAKQYATTYIDGDQKGFVPTRADYYWTGTPHASTSTRIAQCRAGGKEVKLSALGFVLMAIIGLGMAPAQNVHLATGFQGGATYQRSIYEQRRFSLLGDMRNTPVAFMRQQADLMDLLRFDLTDPPQPLVLHCQRTDRDGRAIGEEVFIPAVIEPGPGNTFDNLYGEQTELRFSQTYLPTLVNVGEVGAVLDYQDSTANCNYIMQRSAAGVWSTLANGANGNILDMAYGPDGSLYVVGSFTTIGGVAAARVARIAPDGTITALGAGAAGGVVYGVCVDAAGIVYVTGTFNTLGGAAVSQIGYWNGAAWSAMGTGLNGTGGRAITMDRDNLPIVVGTFTTANGVAANRIAKWTGATFTTYSTGLSAGVSGIYVRPSDGYIFITGSFLTSTAGATLNYVGYWDGSGAWLAMGSGIAGTQGYAVKGAPNGEIYVAGQFTTYNVWRWSGSQWFVVGSPPAATAAVGLAFEPSGMLWVGSGAPTYYGDELMRWNGSTYTRTDISLPGTDSLTEAIAIGIDGRITIGGYPAGGGGGWSGTARYSGLTTVNNPGDAPAYPVIEMTGPGVPTSIRNVTTGKEITFTGLTLITGETAYLILDPSNIQFYSNFRSRLEQHINRGSQEAEFYLQGRSETNPTGANSIALYIAETTGASTSAIIHFHPRYQSLQSLGYR